MIGASVLVARALWSKQYSSLCDDLRSRERYAYSEGATQFSMYFDHWSPFTEMMIDYARTAGYTTTLDRGTLICST